MPLKIHKCLFFAIVGVLILFLAGCAASRLGGKTVRETFPTESVASFVNAVSAGDYADAEKLIKADVNVNAVGVDGISPLLWIMGTTLDVTKIEYMLKAGADPNYRDSKSKASAMSIAAGGNRLDILEALLKNKGDPNLVGPREENLLMIAAGQFREKNIEMLLKYGADINGHDRHQATVAIKAARLGRFDWVADFLNQGLTYNLQGLAKSVEVRQVPPNSGQQRWKEKVIEVLKAKGVTSPTFVACYPPGDARRKEEDCKRLKS
ncbi:ankyrin repeat domain-containing protein [Herbaspirillum sp. GCM10030257]|uniref:ankyrin repeat domain-containing protein n=1 Tax=Herbaspirillum sp. GCM10030257 TaxID=3273393 RepID=UPI003624384C